MLNVHLRETEIDEALVVSALVQCKLLVLDPMGSSLYL